MAGKLATRFGYAIVAAVAAAASSPGAAQEWSVQSGAAARAEYNDNYFFTAPGQTPSPSEGSPVSRQSAVTGSITPFVTAARRTETSDVTALLAVGANKVWGVSPTTDYLSGRFALDGSLREVRSTWTGTLSLERTPSLQSPTNQTGVLVLAYTNAAAAKGTYTYLLTERWSLGATAGGYGNRYESVESTSSLSNNRGYYAGVNAGYAYSDRSQFTVQTAYSHYASDLTRSDAVTATLGVVHHFSPQLTVSASAGGFWSETRAAQDVLACPTAPVDCDNGSVPGVPVTTSDKRHDKGQLYGGNVSYAFSDRDQLDASLSESLSPSSNGTLSRRDSVGATLSHQFSELIIGRLGFSYDRTTYPAALQGSSTDTYYQSEVGVSYRLAERWTLDAGYRYARAHYSLNLSEPRSNIVFVSVGYNWPGTSFTGWVGTRQDSQGLPGAKPVPPPEHSSGGTGAAGTAPDAGLPAASPFDRLNLP